jgi:toxin ParE1/3/4
MASRVRAVVWSESAQRALDEVIEYIANDSRPVAERVLEAALDLAANFATLSARGRVVPELDDPAIREVFVFQYRLMYRVEGTRVVVVAFLHGARDFADWRTKQGLE